MYSEDQVRKIIKQTIDCKVYIDDVTDRICFRFGDFEFEFYKDFNTVLAIQRINELTPLLLAGMCENIASAITDFYKNNKQKFN